MKKEYRIIGINQALKCAKVYPKCGSTKSLSDLKTVTLFLTREQADKFGRALLDAKGQSLGTLRVVAFREPLADGRAYRLTVSGYEKAPATLLRSPDDLEEMD